MNKFLIELVASTFFLYVILATNNAIAIGAALAITIILGGGDVILIGQLIETATKKKNGEKYQVETSSDKSLISHLMAFAADEARIDKTIIIFKDFTD